MLKETEETKDFFVSFLSLVTFQLRVPGPPGHPLATPMLPPVQPTTCGKTTPFPNAQRKTRKL